MFQINTLRFLIHLVGIFPGAISAFFLVGCAQADHRISLREFMADQQAATTSPTAATRPAEELDSLRRQLQTQLNPYKPGPGDLLTVTLISTEMVNPAPSMQVRIDKDGKVKLPIVGQLGVADRSLEDIEALIRQAYMNGIYRDVTITVAVMEPAMTEVMVRGAVTQPGLVALPRNRRNILFAIVKAGGVSEMASGIVTLHRIQHEAEARTLDLYDIQDVRTALTLAPLETGDVITVRAATPNTVFVGGLVNSPHPQMYPIGTEITVLQAIAGANGLRTDVTPREGTLIRRTADQTEVHVRLDLDRISRGIDPNIALAPGDILWIPESPETKMQEWINRNVFLRAGLNATAGANYSASGVEFLNNNARMVHTSGNSLGTLQDRFDPFGFLLQNMDIQRLPRSP